MTPLLELAAVLKDYRALRPLRVEAVSLEPGDQVAILGLDQHAAEVLVNLITGTILPDQGAVRVFGRPTDAIADSDDWLATVDRFGIVSDRAVLLEALSVVQNLAVPFSLDIEPPGDALRSRAVALAREVNIAPGEWERRVGDLSGALRARVRLARALALGPDVVLLEHPTASVDRKDVAALGREIRAIVARRSAAALTLTADAEFADAVAPRVLTLDPATGRLAERRRPGWFHRRG